MLGSDMKDKRTRAERKADDRDSVRSNISDLGVAGAMLWAEQELPKVPPANVGKRRMLVLTILEASRQLELLMRRARRLARCHRQGLKQAGRWTP